MKLGNDRISLRKATCKILTIEKQTLNSLTKAYGQILDRHPCARLWIRVLHLFQEPFPHDILKVRQSIGLDNLSLDTKMTSCSSALKIRWQHIEHEIRTPVAHAPSPLWAPDPLILRVRRWTRGAGSRTSRWIALESAPRCPTAAICEFYRQRRRKSTKPEPGLRPLYAE